MHEELVNCLGGLSLPRKNAVRLNDHPDMNLDVYHGRKTTTQQQQQPYLWDIQPESTEAKKKKKKELFYSGYTLLYHASYVWIYKKILNAVQDEHLSYLLWLLTSLPH